jgi:hypothetical protein
VIEPEFNSNSFGENQKAGRNERCERSGGPHRRDELSSPDSQPDTAGRLFEHVIRQTREQADACLERGGKVDFSVHCAACDFRDFLPAPNEIGELVEHFVLDDRRFQVGDEEALASVYDGLNQNINFGIADHGARGHLGERRVGRMENKIAGVIRQPAWLARNPGRAGDCIG